ncbi:MAG: hypoxanthine phosphoribosyltransferase [Planctomycetaceae bacterium]|nr:hypoxanthine phosphoribosyltransferase [Planctomycetaceae bacterium]
MAAEEESRPWRDAAVRRLISEEEIRSAVEQLGRQISDDYEDRPLTILGVLTGSIMLVTDLIRQIELPLKLGLIQASSYRGTATTPSELRINTTLVPDITDRHVLLVDDIFDTGKTMEGLMESLQSFNPRSIKSAVLLWKKVRTIVDLEPDYHCFLIPDEFVVGYGLDYNDEYRHLPYIGVVESD